MVQDNRGYRDRLVVLVISLLFFSPAFAASKYKVIYSFQGGTDGAYPISDLIADAEGNLYGTTSQGGTGCGGQGCGTVFQLVKTSKGWEEKIIYNFPNGTVAVPVVGLISDAIGNLYGIAGTAVFELSRNKHGGWSETVLHDFFFTDNFSAAGKLAFDTNGNLYGTSSVGGNYQGVCGGNDDTGCGYVFQLVPQGNGTWQESQIYEFASSPDGQSPSSGLTFDSVGNAYGTTKFGGAGVCLGYGSFTGCGTVYKLTLGSDGKWTETVLYNFTRGGGAAISPASGVLVEGTNHLYSASLAGGNGLGTVFELNDSPTKGWEQTVLHMFAGKPDGGTLSDATIGKPAMDSHRRFFGTTPFGGNGQGVRSSGVLFELISTQSGWKEMVLHRFANTGDGAQPAAGVLELSGNLYGTTVRGGSNNFGTVYEMNFSGDSDDK